MTGDIDMNNNDLNNVASLTATNGNFSGDVSANQFIGNGSLLTGIEGDNSSFNQSLIDSLYVPFIGADQDVDLGANDIKADEVDTRKLRNSLGASINVEDTLQMDETLITWSDGYIQSIVGNSLTIGAHGLGYLKGSSSNVVGWYNGIFFPSGNGIINNGDVLARWNTLYSVDGDFSGDVSAATFNSGTLSGNNSGDQDLSGYIPYGIDVDLGAYDLTSTGIGTFGKGKFGDAPDASTFPFHIRDSASEVFKVESTSNQYVIQRFDVGGNAGEMYFIGYGRYHPNKGIFAIKSNLATYGRIAFFTNSAERLQIENDGSINAFANDFTTTGLGNLGSLIIDTDTLVVDASGYRGNVGIGTTSPSEKLEVNGNIKQTSDNDKIFQGAGDDTSETFTGTTRISNAEVGSPEYNWTNYGGYNFDNNITSDEYILGKNQVTQYHRNATINTTLANTWVNVTWDLTIDEETTSGYLLTDSNASIVIGNTGIYRVQGCLHPKNNGLGNQEAKLYSRILINGVEAKCLQFSNSKEFKTTGIDTMQFIGTIYAEAGQKVQLQYYVTNLNIDFEGDAVFDNGVASSLNLERISN